MENKSQAQVATQITWTTDAQRIANLFCRYDSEKRTVVIYTPMGGIVISNINPEIMDVCGYIGMHLAGKPIGETEQIVNGLKLWK